MIEHINERLVRWADWAAGGRRAAGLGFSPCTLARWEVTCSLRPVDPGYDDEAAATDKAVSLLPSELHQVVVAFYLKPGTAKQKARECGMHRDTMYDRLHHAHQRIEQLLTDAKKRRAWPVRSSLARSE